MLIGGDKCTTNRTLHFLCRWRIFGGLKESSIMFLVSSNSCTKLLKCQMGMRGGYGLYYSVIVLLYISLRVHNTVYA